MIKKADPPSEKRKNHHSPIKTARSKPRETKNSSLTHQNGPLQTPRDEKIVSHPSKRPDPTPERRKNRLSPIKTACSTLRETKKSSLIHQNSPIHPPKDEKIVSHPSKQPDPTPERRKIRLSPIKTARSNPRETKKSSLTHQNSPIHPPKDEKIVSHPPKRPAPTSERRKNRLSSSKKARTNFQIQNKIGPLAFRNVSGIRGSRFFRCLSLSAITPSSCKCRWKTPPGPRREALRSGAPAGRAGSCTAPTYPCPAHKPPAAT